VEMCGQVVTRLTNLPNVPFPEPGAPYNNTARGLEAETLAATTVFNCDKNDATMPKIGVHEYGPPEA